jgi:hypothetical protein
MPKKVTKGTGITKVSGRLFDVINPNDRQALIEWFDTLDNRAEDQYSETEQIAQKILRDANLPDDPRKIYYWGKNPNWWRTAKRKFKSLFTARGKNRLRRNVSSLMGYGSINGVLEAFGYEEDSREGYAQKLLEHISRVRRAIITGNSKDAALWGEKIGWLTCEAQMKFKWEKTSLYGLERWESRDKGSKAKKRAKGISAAFQELIDDDPDRKWEQTWGCFPESYSDPITVPVDGIQYDIYRDGEKLVQVDENGGERSIAKTSAKRYFYNARNNFRTS